jgi:hypothetical protein
MKTREELYAENKELRRKLLLAIEDLWPCGSCNTQMLTEGERLAGKCEECCPK